MPEAGLRTLTGARASWRAVVAALVSEWGEQAAGGRMPGRDPLGGWGVAASPAPKRAAATGEPCARVRVRVHNPTSGIAHLPASREWRPVLAPA